MEAEPSFLTRLDHFISRYDKDAIVVVGKNVREPGELPEGGEYRLGFAEPEAGQPRVLTSGSRQTRTKILAYFAR